MQSFPSGLYHFYEIKSVCLSAGQDRPGQGERARTRTLRGLGFAWMDIERIALQSQPKKEKEKEKERKGGGHTASRAIRALQRRKERGRCYQERKELERTG